MYKRKFQDFSNGMISNGVLDLNIEEKLQTSWKNPSIGKFIFIKTSFYCKNISTKEIFPIKINNNQNAVHVLNINMYR